MHEELHSFLILFFLLLLLLELLLLKEIVLGLDAVRVGVQISAGLDLAGLSIDWNGGNSASCAIFRDG